MRDDLTITEIKPSRPHEITSMWNICMCVFRRKKNKQILNRTTNESNELQIFALCVISSLRWGFCLKRN